MPPLTMSKPFCTSVLRFFIYKIRGDIIRAYYFSGLLWSSVRLCLWSTVAYWFSNCNVYKKFLESTAPEIQIQQFWTCMHKSLFLINHFRSLQIRGSQKNEDHILEKKNLSLSSKTLVFLSIILGTCLKCKFLKHILRNSDSIKLGQGTESSFYQTLQVIQM